MAKLSVVILTFNEEKNIARCIDCGRRVADEIVVVDSFSRDRTEEICRDKEITFIQHEFEGHIEQKNWARKQASHPYVLSLDADEALSERLEKGILAEKEKGFPYDGYFFNRMTNFCGKWIRNCGWYPDKKLRLWDNEKGNWEGENPHDRFEMEKGATLKYLKGDLLHYSFYSIEEHMQTVNKFSSISANMRYRRGRKKDY